MNTIRNLFLVLLVLGFIAVYPFVEKQFITDDRKPAATEAEPFQAYKKDGTYTFNYTYKGDKHTIVGMEFRSAAKECFRHYFSKIKEFNEEAGLDIIDSCANPKK